MQIQEMALSIDGMMLTFGFSTKRSTCAESSMTTTPYLLGSSTCVDRHEQVASESEQAEVSAKDQQTDARPHSQGNASLSMLKTQEAHRQCSHGSLIIKQTLLHLLLTCCPSVACRTAERLQSKYAWMVMNV